MYFKSDIHNTYIMLGAIIMVRVLKPIYAKTDISLLDSKFSYKPSEVVQLLSTIVQLQGLPITVQETPEGCVQFIIDNSTYTIIEEEQLASVQ